mmetsp:Transcript_4108/g.7940  ORF Transcript_4108/g.7940 Transcript_4108/m.7940 type:complete len:222 (+) Transcript_4108:181-846(+)|eukprot:CAMPEP_0171638676 /NCGR_PEP_ID=MMETSP0990-20121206/29150_1 /TAXON_ID=483369 /ORGANISM="non described non described, Strain CCMP2098" /LENGTH=221 /DNA_ID=CAMNT_0012212049 /DNA_START=143 /DNA_END=808 /DNA_ORIENTATION=+
MDTTDEALTSTPKNVGSRDEEVAPTSPPTVSSSETSYTCTTDATTQEASLPLSPSSADIISPPISNASSLPSPPSSQFSAPQPETPPQQENGGSPASAPAQLPTGSSFRSPTSSPTSPPQQVTTSEPPKTAAMTKIKVHLQAVGSAPILRKSKFAVGADENVAVISQFLRKLLKLDHNAPLFVYCNSAFVPSPDQKIRDLFQCFGRSNELQLNYSIQEAWG